jgi:hypothetical protein
MLRVAVAKNMEERKRIASELAERLKADDNIVAVALCPQVEPAPGEEAPAPEMLVVVYRMPFDLDMLGMKRVLVGGSSVALFYVTPERLRAAIDDEAGCWFTSGRVLYSETVHDPKGILVELRKTVNSVTKERRSAAFETWFKEAKAFPAIALRRGITSMDDPEMILLRDDAALARALFLLNSRPPRGPASLIEDIMSLQRLPSGFHAIADILKGLDRLNLKKFEKARKAYNDLISDVKSLAMNL